MAVSDSASSVSLAEPHRATSASHSPETPLTSTSCPLCGEPLQNLESCNRCDWVKGYRHRDSISNFQPRDLVAVALSVVPGLGHFYKGHNKAALGFFLGVVVVIALLSALGIEGMGFQFLLLPVYWLWVMIQAYLIDDQRAPSFLSPK